MEVVVRDSCMSRMWTIQMSRTAICIQWRVDDLMSVADSFDNLPLSLSKVEIFDVDALEWELLFATVE